MASGIHIPDEIKDIFADVKLRHTYRFITLKLSEDYKKIEVEAKSNGSFDDMRTLLISASDKNEGRYVIYDHNEKLFLITWSDDEKASLKQKMILSSSKRDLQKKLGGGFKEININDVSDLCEQSLDTLMSK